MREEFSSGIIEEVCRPGNKEEGCRPGYIGEGCRPNNSITGSDLEIRGRGLHLQVWGMDLVICENCTVLILFGMGTDLGISERVVKIIIICWGEDLEVWEGVQM